jgi:UDPglucose--hexose-1-phosphate uridylyltransferase
MSLEFDRHPHRRFNPLTGHWILVSPHRTARPWQGQQEPPGQSRPTYDPKCYLCPGNLRAGGVRNDNYTGVYVFTNDFSALLEQTPDSPPDPDPLLRAEPVRGTCRVVCFSDRHDLTLPEMPVSGIRSVVDTWAAQTDELLRVYRWVQVFENKGPVMGCSNPHPHGQIWASSSLPNEPALEDARQREYWQTHDQPLLLNYLDRELQQGERLVATNDHWIALVPFWAVWPFETLLLPRRHVPRLPDLDPAQRDALALILKDLLQRYDALFSTSFPYSMGWHGAPAGTENTAAWQLHAHFYPPLLRSAQVKKFMVGYEMLAEPQRDLTAEQAAQRLRQIPSAT